MADEELELDVEEKPKSKKTMIIVIVAVVLLNVIGVGAWLFLSGGDSSSDNSPKEEKELGPLSYHTLVPEFVVNFGPGSKVRYLQVDIQVATRDPSSLGVVATYKPVIRNDILVLLSGVSFEVLNTRKGKEGLQKKILNTINRIVSEASHAAPEKDKEEKGEHVKEGEHGKTDETHASAEEEMVAGPIENIYFASFIMQ